MMLEKLEFCPRCKREDLSQSEYDHQFCNSCDMPIGQIGYALQREREAANQNYPIVLADFHHHGEHYQVRNQQERLWIVHERPYSNEDSGWEVMWAL